VLVAVGALVGLWVFRRELQRSGLPESALDSAVAGVPGDLAQIGDEHKRVGTATLRRKRQMESAGLIARSACDAPLRVEYRLTPHGRSLGPVFETLWSWEVNHLAQRSGKARHDRGRNGDRSFAFLQSEDRSTARGVVRILGTRGGSLINLRVIIRTTVAC
jgi:HxlR-like helix-turn-helix